VELICAWPNLEPSSASVVFPAGCIFSELFVDKWSRSLWPTGFVSAKKQQQSDADNKLDSEKMYRSLEEDFTKI
jgi:hypothetical protein|tara:strand:- start:210 stop:431 length:222 start_codon:yes stop_codon:yes gene_type:complete